MDPILIPKEVAIYGVYFPPYLFALIFGMTLAAFSAFVLNRFRLSRYVFYPPLVFLALAVIYGGLFSIFVVPA